MAQNPTLSMTDDSETSLSPVDRVCTEQTGLPYMVDRVADAIADNQDACLIVSSGIATGVVIWAVSEATIKVIRSLRS